MTASNSAGARARDRTSAMASRILAPRHFTEYALPVVQALLAAVVAGCMRLTSLLRQTMQRQGRQAGHDPGDAISAGPGQSGRAANGLADAVVLCLFRIACRRLDCLYGHVASNALCAHSH